MINILHLLAFIIAILIGPSIIKYLNNIKIKQVVREEGLESHYRKTGTPTMGGFIFMIPFVLCSTILLILKPFDSNTILILLTTIAFSILGFIDDYRKVIKKQNEGLTSKEKLLGQILIALPVSIYSFYMDPAIFIPFLKISISLSYFKIIFIMLVIIATTNAVNFTDGVDGLATSVTAIFLIFYVYISYKMELFSYEISLIMLFSILGFLMYNKNPAKVFMGDMGSLALGGFVASLAITTHTVLLIPIVGIIYFVETVSVILQVIYYKKTRKRLFKMTPIHHHYELKGWSEKKIVLNFSFVTICFSIIGLISIL